MRKFFVVKVLTNGLRHAFIGNKIKASVPSSTGGTYMETRCNSESKLIMTDTRKFVITTRANRITIEYLEKDLLSDL